MMRLHKQFIDNSRSLDRTSNGNPVNNFYLFLHLTCLGIKLGIKLAREMSLVGLVSGQCWDVSVD